jgi:dTDP-4-amino-4,6-dideoxygalactose transaminase
MEGIKMVDLGRQYLRIKDEADRAMAEVIQSTAFINGPAVKSFATALGEYLGTPNIVPCANGTDALQIALMALDLPEKSEIIVPTFNYVAGAEVIGLLGHKPVFVDADPDFFNMDIRKVESAITNKTKAVIAVHLFGQSTHMKELRDLCKKHNLWLVEDNAQAIGGYYNIDGEKISNGLIGDIGTTSFFPSKNLGCYGDGGAVYSRHEDLFMKMKQIANHGQEKKYHYDSIGINSRLDSIQAALLNIKLGHLDAYIDARNRAAEFYDDAFAGLDSVQSPKRFIQAKHVFHQYTLKVDPEQRDALKAGLQEAGIPSMIYYPKPLHLNKAYSRYGYNSGDFPVAEDLCTRVISLPMHTELDDEQLSYICDNFKRIYKI